MCGSVSAIGLQEHERQLWPYVRERLREPGHLMALMRGLLGDTEVAAAVAVTPQGIVRTLAILATPEAIIDELTLAGDEDDNNNNGNNGNNNNGIRQAKVGDYDVQVLVGAWPDGRPRPLAILTTPWIEQHLLLYARNLWRRY